MRILFCNYEYPPLGGGGGVVNALLAEALAERHTVTVLTSQGLGLPRERTEHGVRVVRVPVFFRRKVAAANLISLFAYLPMGYRDGRRLLAEGDYDIINTHFVLPSGPVGDALSSRGDVPNVLSLHGGDLYDPSKSLSPHRHPLLRLWIRRLLSRADRLVGQSRNTIENLHAIYDPDVEAVRIPLGIRRPRYVPVPREEHGYKQGDFLIVTVGRLVARKAVSRMLDLMESFRKASVYLLVIGSGPLQAALQEEALDRGLETQVRFLGQVAEAEKFQYLEMADLYLSTSQHEGFGLVFLEAMACGLPVICYNNGGQVDFLADGETGFLLALNDLDGIRERVRTLIDHPSLREMMGKENRNRVADYYIERCAARYEALFQEVISESRQRVRAFV